jgi:hypothetical protein
MTERERDHDLAARVVQELIELAPADTAPAPRPTFDDLLFDLLELAARADAAGYSTLAYRLRDDHTGIRRFEYVYARRRVDPAAPLPPSPPGR